ncbi:hypothetical protein QAD02_006689 [Eretmocerus hayati]|uniref:Uncharacterized protein n=1 Tax=Eretmocerus hayati TaxID=131215 RepID=A0ACC2N1M2_9HYME|nr:hypothetical protein QAD02_006689 [Eretmocerus hayati]
MSTEKTPLSGPYPDFGSAQSVPFYVQDARRFYSRRRRERQLQCLMFVSIVLTFLIALGLTIGFAVEQDLHAKAGVEQDTGGAAATPATRVKLSSETSRPSLSAEESKTAQKAANAALKARELADSETSSSKKNRSTILTSLEARVEAQALEAVAELGASKAIERARSFMGQPSKVGATLHLAISEDEICAENELGQLVNNVMCPSQPISKRYRTYDGTCNNPSQLGRALSAYKRVLEAEYADGVQTPRTLGILGTLLPSPRRISLQVIEPSVSSNRSFSAMLAAFGQFLERDMTQIAISRGTNGSQISCCPPNGGSHPECFPVNLGSDDPAFHAGGSSCMEFVRSAPAAQCKIGTRQQLNEVSAFIDGSALYGSDADSARASREFISGRLLEPLPTDSNDLNDNLDAEPNHLAVMRLIWSRQHNLVADRLALENPEWDDEKLYQESRRLVIAQLQHVTYAEFLPVVIGESETKAKSLGPLPTGFRPRKQFGTDLDDPSVANHFAAAAFTFVRSPRAARLTAKVTSTTATNKNSEKVGVNTLSSKPDLKATDSTSTRPKTSLYLSEFDPICNQDGSSCKLDFISSNIQRGRDHGLPGYAKWREYCGLTKPTKFDDLAGDIDAQTLDSLLKHYDNVEDVDLYTGASVEMAKGDALLGPTFTCMITRQFQSLQAGDSYWYEFADQPGSFSADQLAAIKNTTFARILCDASDGVISSRIRPMQPAGPNNPTIDCDKIPQVNFSAWKTQQPVLTPTETEIPAQDWIDFTTQVNETIFIMISNIESKKSPNANISNDWVEFHNSINRTLLDLREKLTSLKPKPILNLSQTPKLNAESDTFDWLSLENDINKTVAEIMDSIETNKPPPDSLPAVWAAYKKKINDTIMSVRKKFIVVKPVTLQKSVTEKLDDIPTIDWVQIKTDINSTIMDIVNSVNASKPIDGSPPADWLAFKEKFNNTFLNIKNKFSAIHAKPVLGLRELLNDKGVNLYAPKTTYESKTSKSGSTEKESVNSDEGEPINLTELKSRLNNTFNGIIESIGSDKSLVNTVKWDWITFEHQLNNTFNAFMNEFFGSYSKSYPKKYEKFGAPFDYTSYAQWNTANKTVDDIINKINSQKPAPGSPPEDWIEFGQKMSNTFATSKKTYESESTKNYATSKEKASIFAAPSDDQSFRQNFGATLAGLMTQLKKKPVNGSTPMDWLVYRQEVKASVNKLKYEIDEFKITELLVPVNTSVNSETKNSTFDWTAWKNKINATIDKVLAGLSTVPENTSTAWVGFRDDLKDTLESVKTDIASIQNQIAQAKLMTIINREWLNFKDSVNATVNDALDDIYTYVLSPADAALLNVNFYVKSRLSQVKKDLDALKADFLEKMNYDKSMMRIIGTLPPAASDASYLIDRTYVTSYQWIIILAVNIVHFMV